ncbi:molybdopterin converting factor subunit 1 [Acidiphilium sp. AL]|uniref:Molybdopterin converting factor subunit 1 n=1 Tax=Acidiphilium iwatense TaxID=768198 RepID=A0ABS9E0K9_9PROT|nr:MULTISPECIES: molybdopterin converting factor subunit 1 [Acidiphilium]MCF3947930.1 molybdopterin converting factor subunit 1 [Acidiphilium iwatense]MCU4160935.1 molybdopterin converting factor subunit 1 [Acidiphilium sp. AL]
MKILYFAWLRERIGHAEEDITPPAEVTTIGALTDYLAARSPAHAKAFADRRAIKIALDQRFVTDGAALGTAREVAYFPPFTGG